MENSTYRQIPIDTFDGLQLDAGMILSDFNPEKPSQVNRENILFATTGGVEVSAKPSYSDLGEDIDNCPNGMKENVHLDGYDCSLSSTSLSTTAAGIKRALGAAHIDGTNKVVLDSPGMVKADRFEDVWWVGPKANGGCLAIHLINALSTDGFSLKTSKNGKGQSAFTLMGHYSNEDPNKVPMEIYTIDPVEEPAG